MNINGYEIRPYANLEGADLCGADIRGAYLPYFQIPQTGTLEVWGKKEGKIVKMLVPAEAKRTASLIGRKCRAEFIKTLEIEGTESQRVRGYYNPETIYEEGRTTYPDRYDDDVRLECTHGIHFFLTKEEAINW